MVIRPGANLKQLLDGSTGEVVGSAYLDRSMKTTFTDGAIAVTAAAPGEVLVFKIQGYLTVEQHLRCRAAIGAYLPDDLHFIVVDKHVDVGVMRPVVPTEPPTASD